MDAPPPLFPDWMPGWAQTAIIGAVFVVEILALALGAMWLLSFLSG